MTTDGERLLMEGISTILTSIILQCGENLDWKRTRKASQTRYEGDNIPQLGRNRIFCGEIRIGVGSSMGIGFERGLEGKKGGK